MKPGWKTTEFWLTVLAQVVGLLYASGAIAEGTGIEKVLAIIATVLASLGYAVSRGIAKAANGGG